MVIEKLFKKYRTLAVVSNSNQGKSSLILGELIKLRKKVDKKRKKYNTILSQYNELIEKNPKVTKNKEFVYKLKNLKKITKYYNKFEIYCYGVEESLYEVLRKNGIKIMHNAEDLLDMCINTSAIFIDEINKLFDGKVSNKQTKKFFKFINRIHHLNNYLIATTAESGYWNKTMEDAFRCFIVKAIEYDSLIQRTKLKRKIEGIQSTSSYRLDIPVNTYYIINDDVTEKHTFKYDERLDSKKDNIMIFEDDESEYEDLNIELGEKPSEELGEELGEKPKSENVKEMEKLKNEN